MARAEPVFLHLALMAYVFKFGAMLNLYSIDFTMDSIKMFPVNMNRCETLHELCRRCSYQPEVVKVAFATALLASGHGHIGPLDHDTTLVFRHVFFNIGDAYNPNTGIFTAPVRGVYHFDFSVYDWDVSQPSGASLIKNEEHICMVYGHHGSGAATSSKGITLQLEFEDLVFVRLPKTYKVFDNENHHTLFSGSLVFTM